ncbi:MAG: RNA-binding protein [Rhizobiaceae bacterium MnEN-MB40S]|nr:MAG: RNA-binding protein [Rhizobiaceae bacterium MnEN-MB40S]
MSFLPLAFGAPAVLFGLLALPVIWWLLRLTPPRPKTEPFPPFRILARVLKKEETPSKSPWWLTALRLLMAALVIIALADPILNPQETTVSDEGPLAIVMDNSWATVSDWDERVATAERLISDAESQNVPVSIVFTADRTNDATPDIAARARERLLAAEPRPLPADDLSAIESLTAALHTTPLGTIAVLSDGIAEPGAEHAWDMLAELETAQALIFETDGENTVAITSAENSADGFNLSAVRVNDSAAQTLPITARDNRGRPISTGTLEFAAGERRGQASLSAPFELRNDFAQIVVDNAATAGATYLLDDSFRRRRVALLSAEPLDLTQPLLSPLYYLTRALQPFADLIAPESDELSDAIPEVLEQRPSVVVMADIGTLPEESETELSEWVEDGGMLVRFAGPRMASGIGDDPLVPVKLRQGERTLGGSLSWSEPQPLSEFPENGPFAGMSRPDDVSVNTQVLAEPSPDLAAHTWASLLDGTPLVTSRETGQGRIVLFHVTAEPKWSSLPISGQFVEMLRRSILLSRATTAAGSQDTGVNLPPYQLLNARGALTAPTGAAQPLQIARGDTPVVSFDNPPGLYGAESGFLALNLMRPDDTLEPFVAPEFPVAATRSGFVAGESRDLKPPLLMAAVILLIVDSLVVLGMAGAFARRNFSRPAASSLGMALIAGALVLSSGGNGLAADEMPNDDQILASLDRTHLAYVITGDAIVDETSRQGMTGLSRFLSFRTSLEPGGAVGVDLETDPLALYPMLYWPISVDAEPPSPEAISRIDAFMKNGGTVLFDTRDALAGLDEAAITPETARLRNILADLDIPALEPAPEDHVLTKAFYILNEFPGRYRGSPLWVETSYDAGEESDRPARSGDGVSSIIITGNDLAGAWAIDRNNIPVYPTVPPDPLQREYAYRGGVNIMMYMLTGNYKSDQVHIPALLERLGQ